MVEIIRNIPGLKEKIGQVRTSGKTIGFVPTMGYLHEGHLSLVRVAVEECDFVVVSIYVNPIQFGVGEDYEEYPRDLTRDADLCEKEGVDLIFAPSDKDMYPLGYSTFVDVENLTAGLCGRNRPGHFRGVTTVVTKLFNLVEPHRAYFGQKDAQQALVLKKMIADLNMNLELIVLPTIREKDGLAMSSRNAYLSERERKAGLVLYQSLQKAEELINSGCLISRNIIREMEEIIKQEPLADIDYVEIVDTINLKEIAELKGQVLIALAVKVGKTRLIDNIVVEV